MLSFAESRLLGTSGDNYLSNIEKRGFTLIEVLAVTALIAGLAAGGNYQFAINRANEIRGIANLKQVYALLQVQSAGGSLPAAAFYPAANAAQDPKSIVKLLSGASSELFVSPFAPEALKRKGLTFAWNDSVNGKDLGSLPADTWLLIDVAAFIANPDTPKPTKYLVLYADGRALSVSSLPADIVQVVQEAQAKAGKK